MENLDKEFAKKFGVLSPYVNKEVLKFIRQREKELLSKLVIWIGDYAYRKANPKGKRNTPSIVYEQVEKDLVKFILDL